MKLKLIIILLLIWPVFVLAEGLKPVKLPEPNTKGGMPLMQALKERKSARTFSNQELPLQIISDLLWAASGINRPAMTEADLYDKPNAEDKDITHPELAHRTSPSAKNNQEIDIYLVKADGLYLYDANAHMLLLVLKQDLRALAGNQHFVKEAPINLIYVADLSRMNKISYWDISVYTAADAGFISQNVYLYCASSGLATVVRANINKFALAKAMNLNSKQKIIFAQTVGYPKEKR